MAQTKFLRAVFAFTIVFAAIVVVPMVQPAAAQSSSPKIGVVVMHGKGGSPTKHVADLASSLEGKGYLVANLEMPWSGRRDYDANVAAAEKQVESAFDGLRFGGATKLFVAGHSQGGLFALYFGDKHVVDGIIAIAPGGNPGGRMFRDKLGESVEQARKLIAEGKGGDKTRFLDFENSKGTYPIITTPANYLNWFEPDGEMNQMKAVKNMNAKVPVLFIVPTSDYPGLLNTKQRMFDALPRHPLTKLYEPRSNHIGAPSASLDEILRWTQEVVSQAQAAIQEAPAGAGR